MRTKLFAIITLDVVNSSEMNRQNLDEFIQGSEALLYYPFIQQVEVYRGDGLQSLCELAKDGLKAALVQYCYYKLKGITVRQAVGIGGIDNLTSSLAKSNGVAFQLSGRALNSMKKENLLISLIRENQELNEEWTVHSSVLSDMFENWSAPQIEAILPSLLGQTQQQIATKLGISQAAVNHRLKSAKLSLLQRIMNRYVQQF